MLQVQCNKIHTGSRNRSIFPMRHDRAVPRPKPVFPPPADLTMPQPKRTAAIIVAAGRGLRAGSGGPKQYRSIGGRTVISRAMAPFCRHPQIFAVQPVLNRDDAAMFNEAVCDMRYQPPADGGATRQASVRAGLEALVGQTPDIVLIHD